VKLLFVIILNSIQMEETVKQRLVRFIKYKGLGQSKFEKLVGLSNGYISNLKSNPSPEKIMNIFGVFPGGSFIYSDNLYNAKNMYCFMYHSEFILRLMQSLMKRLLFSCLLT